MEHPSPQIEDRKTMSDLSPIAAELIDRLSRIEGSVKQLVKTVEGDNSPGLVGRVGTLESSKAAADGVDKIKTRFMGVSMTLMVALLSASVSLAVMHNNHEETSRAAMDAYQARQDNQIQALSIDVAVILQAMHGADGQQGVPGARGVHGTQGAQGDRGVQGVAGAKGGIRIFSK